MNRFNVEDRAQFYSRGAVGTILRVINGGMAYLFLADSGAKFTARADELAPIGSPDRVAPSVSPGDARTVFVFEHPHSGARQRTPSQQQQSQAYQWPKRADGSSKTVGEMTRPERDAMLQNVRPRLQRFADELSAGLAAQDANCAREGAVMNSVLYFIVRVETSNRDLVGPDAGELLQAAIDVGVEGNPELRDTAVRVLSGHAEEA